MIVDNHVRDQPVAYYHSAYEIEPNSEYDLPIGCLNHVITLFKLAVVLYECREWQSSRMAAELSNVSYHNHKWFIFKFLLADLWAWGTESSYMNLLFNLFCAWDAYLKVSRGLRITYNTI